MTAFDAATPILGGPSATPLQFAAFFSRFAPRTSAKTAIIAAYQCMGDLTGIGNAVPFCQAVHETASFTSIRWKQSFNPAGLGATNDGAWGAHFRTPAEGVFAQYCHLLAYAVPLAQASFLHARLIVISPRFDAVRTKNWQGAAPTWADLNGKWADPGTNYAQAIFRMLPKLLV